MKKNLLAITLIFCTSLVFAQNKATDVLGVWLTSEGEAKIEIYQVGQKFCGKIVWLKEPNENGKPKIDAKNVKPELRSRPILGMSLMENFVFDGKYQWSNGTIYDSRSGKTYSCKMWLKDGNTLQMRGYLGVSLLGQTTTWTKTTF